MEAIAQMGSSRKNEKKSGSSEHVLCKQAMKRKTFTIKKAVADGADNIPLSSEGNVLLASWCCFPHSSWHRRGRWFFKEGELHGVMRNGLIF